MISSIFERPPSSSKEIEKEVLRLLTRKGPLYVSQISVALLLPVRDVMVTLNILRECGEVRARIDQDDSGRSDDSCAAWEV